jgi:hypothetical protein
MRKNFCGPASGYSSPPQREPRGLHALGVELPDSDTRTSSWRSRQYIWAGQRTVPNSGANGVLATIGGRFGWWALLMQDSKPAFVYALSDQPDHKFRIVSDQPISAGNHVVRFSLKYDGDGIVRTRVSAT